MGIFRNFLESAGHFLAKYLVSWCFLSGIQWS